MANDNKNLCNAKSAKNDEFYTQLSDIENELRYYRPHFKDKVVLCNCNDALHTGFATYFSMMFEILGLKELICTSFAMEEGSYGMVFRYHGDKNENGIPDIEEWEQTPMKGNGGFNTEEGIELIKEADIIVTNPPFSLFREFISILMEYDKKFLVIGNLNAITYKEIFPFIKDNKIWLGCSSFNRGMYFKVPDGFKYSDTYKFDRIQNGVNVNRVSSVCWFTNLDHTKRNEPFDLYKKYNEEEYPKYDGQDVIEVSKAADIPIDYDGVMGVPITFLDKYCPEQFEIVGEANHGRDSEWDLFTPLINGKIIYKRILIRHKK